MQLVVAFCFKKSQFQLLPQAYKKQKKNSEDRTYFAKPSTACFRISIEAAMGKIYPQHNLVSDRKHPQLLR
jgi:hypothetical protein